jgi:lysophospholipid acyltransferase (LPLAT)-like uncharacterized protein
MDHFFVGRRSAAACASWPSPDVQAAAQWIYTHGGVFPVRRGHKDEEALKTARTVLDRGGAMVMYCEGGRSRTAKLAETARPGIGRLALQTGAAVVPVAIHGSSHVRNWKRLQFPKVTVLYGDPMRWEPIESRHASSSSRSPTRSSPRSAACTRASTPMAAAASCATSASSAAASAEARLPPPERRQAKRRAIRRSSSVT